MSAPSPVNMTFDDIRLDSPLLNAGRRLLEIVLSDKEKHLFHCWTITIRATNNDPGFLRLIFPPKGLTQYESGLVERMDEAQCKKCARMARELETLNSAEMNVVFFPVGQKGRFNFSLQKLDDHLELRGGQ